MEQKEIGDIEITLVSTEEIRLRLFDGHDETTLTLLDAALLAAWLTQWLQETR